MKPEELSRRTVRFYNRYNELVASLAARLFAEDRAAMEIREILRRREKDTKRTGFKSR